MSDTAIDPRFTKRERQPGLDSLRALAIVLVVIYHTGIFGFALPYLSHKLVIHFVIQLCSRHNLALTSVPALLLVEVFIYVGGTILFLAVERPFLRLRHRLAPRVRLAS